jgi:hypothetical protein
VRGEQENPKKSNSLTGLVALLSLCSTTTRSTAFPTARKQEHAMSEVVRVWYAVVCATAQQVEPSRTRTHRSR